MRPAHRLLAGVLAAGAFLTAGCAQSVDPIERLGRKAAQGMSPHAPPRPPHAPVAPPHAPPRPPRTPAPPPHAPALPAPALRAPAPAPASVLAPVPPSARANTRGPHRRARPARRVLPWRPPARAHGARAPLPYGTLGSRAAFP
ncbi:hypothetical protein ACIOJD_05190 [Streptomyces sp. NPDC088116]|uniref:hypothetical protein n=1 Tax=Streptomyces sp. NPDC088116 TaxID=3365825 RepID=UPI0038246FA0